MDPGDRRRRGRLDRQPRSAGGAVRAVLDAALRLRATPRLRCPAGAGSDAGVLRPPAGKGRPASGDPSRGKFRSFLISSFKHFVSNVRDHDRAQKRGGGQPHLQLEFDTAEARYQAEPAASTLTPEELFERQWAVQLVERVRAQLAAERERAGAGEQFARLAGFLNGDPEPGGYEELARDTGTTEGALRVTVHRLRRRFRELLRAEIAATVADDSEIEVDPAHDQRTVGLTLAAPSPAAVAPVAPEAAARSWPSWWLVVAVAAFLAYFLLLIVAELRRPVATGFTLEGAGMRIASVEASSPASAAGLQIGDRVMPPAGGASGIVATGTPTRPIS